MGIINPLFALVLLLSLSTAFADDDDKDVFDYENDSIMSDDPSEHAGVLSNVSIADGWTTTADKHGRYCKEFTEKTSLTDLKELFKFATMDLVEMDALKEGEIPDFSDYFLSCNYIGFYDEPWLSWLTSGNRENVEFKWLETDAYIDNQYSLLLVDYLDEEKTTARAVYVYKKYQGYANKSVNRSIWDDLKVAWRVLTE